MINGTLHWVYTTALEEKLSDIIDDLQKSLNKFKDVFRGLPGVNTRKRSRSKKENKRKTKKRRRDRFSSRVMSLLGRLATPEIAHLCFPSREVDDTPNIKICTPIDIDFRIVKTDEKILGHLIQKGVFDGVAKTQILQLYEAIKLKSQTPIEDGSTSIDSGQDSTGVHTDSSIDSDDDCMNTDDDYNIGDTSSSVHADAGINDAICGSVDDGVSSQMLAMLVMPSLVLVLMLAVLVMPSLVLVLIVLVMPSLVLVLMMPSLVYSIVLAVQVSQKILNTLNILFQVVRHQFFICRSCQKNAIILIDSIHSF
jgi:hypothetical protein